MTTSATNNRLGCIILEGIEYDVKVSYTNDQGEDLPCNSTSSIDSSKLSQLHTLITNIATAHVHHSGRKFKDLNILHLAANGIEFPDHSMQSHDNLEVASEKVSDLWKKTSDILIENYKQSLEDCIEIPVTTSTTTASSAPVDTKVTTSIHLEATPPFINERTQANTLTQEELAHQGNPIEHEGQTTWTQKAWKYGTKLVHAVFPQSVPPKPPLAPLKNLPSNFSSSALDTKRATIITNHLTLKPAPTPPPKEKTGFFSSLFKKKDSTAPPSPSVLPTFTANKQLQEDLKAFIDEIYNETAKKYGFGAFIEAMHSQCEALTIGAPSEANGHLNSVKIMFNDTLIDKIMEEYRKDDKNKDYARQLHQAFLERFKNKSHPGKTLTLTSFGIS